MTIKERHEELKKHLSEENPILLEIVQKYELLDNIGYETGFLDEEDSYTADISWWPIISVLGTFSAGKSTFINNYIGSNIQESGNQAVDDKFTAICYSKDENTKTLPGIALNSDPRFPFYGISEEVDKIQAGEGDRINLYMQLKTAPSQTLKGKIFIDSPGFDADNQRNTILRMTKHIIDISDLVLIFFDARHPEPGAMRDTLEHLVHTTMNHTDADKVLYILNQIDTTAKEDNLEDVISAWQRSLAQGGLITGNFYTIYNEESSNTIEDEAVKDRLKLKKDTHLKKIQDRIDDVGTQRAYKIANMLKELSNSYKKDKFIKLKESLDSWSKKVFIIDVVVLVLVLGIIGSLQFSFGLISFDPISVGVGGGITLLTLIYSHFKVRKFIALREIADVTKDDEALRNAIKISTKWYKTTSAHKSKNWNKKHLNTLEELIKQSNSTIQQLNNQFIS